MASNTQRQLKDPKLGIWTLPQITCSKIHNLFNSNYVSMATLYNQLNLSNLPEATHIKLPDLVAIAISVRLNPRVMLVKLGAANQT